MYIWPEWVFSRIQREFESDLNEWRNGETIRFGKRRYTTEHKAIQRALHILWFTNNKYHGRSHNDQYPYDNIDPAESRAS